MIGRILALFSLSTPAFAQEIEMPVPLEASGSVLEHCFVALLALLISQATVSPLRRLQSTGFLPFVFRIVFFWVIFRI